MKHFRLTETFIKTFANFAAAYTLYYSMRKLYDAPQCEVLELQLGINILSNDSPNGGYDQNDLGDI